MAFWQCLRVFKIVPPVLSQVSFFDGSTSCPFAGASHQFLSLQYSFLFFNPPLRVTCIFSISNHFIDWLCAHQEKLHIHIWSERLMHKKERERDAGIDAPALSARRLDIQSMWHLKSLQKADLLYYIYIYIMRRAVIYIPWCVCACVYFTYVRPGTWGTTPLMAHLCVHQAQG